jgi:hypothetical protein
MTRDGKSVARAVAEVAMQSVGLDPSDFRQRDRIIIAISGMVNAALDAATKGGG